ncbi:MAG: helix-turn-helix domain-containing protein [Treponema sp.]|jgi:transcriptional regulator with XRE-family HTH domain|nr:helix-turn-helix domain-containing protein [Treponema sp.]
MDGQYIKRILGKNIKLLRARRGLSQANFAEKANISIPFLSNIERGIKYPQPNILSRIVNALGVEVNELFINNNEIDKSKELLCLLSEDMKKNVDSAMAEVFNRYLG